MDTSVAEIEFDFSGQCNYCSAAREVLGRKWFPTSEGKSVLSDIFNDVRTTGSRMQFDCILGLSGGLDSAEVARRAVEAGLRPLAVHVDGGWNTEVSVSNVKNLVNNLGLTLETVVIDWSEMRALQLAFLESGTLNQDIPQDHAFFVSLYQVAIRRKIPTILSGLNWATESIEPQSWGYSNQDGLHVKSVYESVTGKRLRKYPIMSYEKYRKLRNKGKFRVLEPLNYGVFNPQSTLELLKNNFSFKGYETKHAESLFTHWFQSVYLLERYGIDKRRNYFSSQIISGLMLRDEAIGLLRSESISSVQRHNLTQSVADKLGLDVDSLESLMENPHRSNHSFKTTFRDWVSPSI